MVRFILIRHGETVWNRQARMQGRQDSPLTERGREQASATGRRLKSEACALLLHSDLGRTCQTASLIARECGLRLQAEPQLRERALGIMEGLTKEQVRQRYPEQFRSYQSRRADYVIPDGESLQQVFDRTRDCLSRIAMGFDGATVAVVTHGGILDAAYRLATGMALELPRQFSLANAGLNRISSHRLRWRLDAWGEIDHLAELIDH